MFSKTSHFPPLNVLICLYNSLLSLFLQYGILVWGLKYEFSINPVFLLQKRVIRVIKFENSTSHSTFIISALKILKLFDAFQLKLLTFIYESTNKISPACFHNFFKPVASVHQYRTGQADKGDIFFDSEKYSVIRSWSNTLTRIKVSE